MPPETNKGLRRYSVCRLPARAALSDAKNGDIIRLLQSIDNSGGITVSGKNITFDLNGHDLNVVNTAVGQDGLTVVNGGVALTGAGEFNVTGSRCGVYASGGGTAAEVTRATRAATIMKALVAAPALWTALWSLSMKTSRAIIMALPPTARAAASP